MPVPPSAPMPRVSSRRHLTFVLMEAERARDCGDLQAERANLLHAVFVAATEGMGQMTAVDLVRQLNRLGPFDVAPGAGE